MCFERAGRLAGAKAVGLRPARAAQARLEGAKERVETDAAVRAELAGKAAADAAAAERKAAADKEAAAAAQRIEEEAAQRAEAAAGS